MEIDKVFNNGIDGVADNLFSAVNNSVSEIKAMQQRKAAENVQLVIQALKKIDSDIRSRYDEVGNSIEKRVATIKDGRDGINGKDGKNGKDGRDGKQGVQGTKGQDGINGRDGLDGVDGVSVTSAHIDFDGSLIIGLSSGVELNVGEVLAPSLAESIKVITNGGGTSQSVIDTLASLQTQITALIPSQTGNSGKFLTTNGTTTSWSSTPTFTSITDSGNLTFTGTGNRITGDFSNATVASRVAFQSSTTNGSTGVIFIPNGTGPNSNIQIHNNSDTTNSGYAQIVSNATESSFRSNINGTGTYLPMTFYTGGSESMRIDTGRNVLIGTTTVPVSGNGTVSIAGTGTYTYTGSNGGSTSGQYQSLEIQNSTVFNSTGAAGLTFNAINLLPIASHDATGGTTALTVRGGNFFPLVSSSATTSILAMSGINSVAQRNYSTDVSSAATNSLYGVQAQHGHATTLSTSANTSNSFGINIIGAALSGGITNYGGLRMDNAVNPTTGTVALTNIYGINQVTSNFGNSTGIATATQWFGANLGGLTVGANGTITNYYGLYITAPTVTGTVTNRYSIYQADTAGTNYFAATVSIGTTSPSASAILDAQSTIKGVRFPNMTTTQKNAISSPAAGLVVFDTTLSKLAVYSGTAWQTITSV